MSSSSTDIRSSLRTVQCKFKTLTHPLDVNGIITAMPGGERGGGTDTLFRLRCGKTYPIVQLGK